MLADQQTFVCWSSLSAIGVLSSQTFVSQHVEHNAHRVRDDCGRTRVAPVWHFFRQAVAAIEFAKLLPVPLARHAHAVTGSSETVGPGAREAISVESSADSLRNGCVDVSPENDGS